MKIALAQINTTVGDLSGNAAKIRSADGVMIGVAFCKFLIRPGQ